MQAPPPVPKPPLPPGWVSATDPVSGRIYYANPSTGETQWTPPALPPPPPPPPVAPPPPQAASARAQSMPTNATLTLCGPLLVTQVQTLLQTSDNANSLLEERLSAGTIADLCNLQKQQGESEYYAPLEPNKLDSNTAIPPTMEHGRLEIRTQSLHDKLQRIQRE